MPTALMTRSTLISCALPATVMVAVTSLAPFFRFETVALVRIFIPCFSNAFLAKAETSASSTGSTRSMTSATVTSAPMVR